MKSGLTFDIGQAMKITAIILLLLSSCTPFLNCDIHCSCKEDFDSSYLDMELVHSGYFTLLLKKDQFGFLKEDEYYLIPRGVSTPIVFKEHESSFQFEDRLSGTLSQHGFYSLIDDLVTREYSWEDLPALINRANILKKLKNEKIYEDD